MTRDVLETAIKEGIPFVIKTADGEKYEVRDHYRIALGLTRVVVMDDRDLPHILPLITMTGVSYLANGNSHGAAQ
jgi:hypothetical protein